MNNKLTGRVGVQIKAVLSSLHGEGFDIRGLERQADNAMSRGQAPAAAYERAVADFLRVNPGIKPAVERVARLVQHSDDATVAAYDRALDAYIAGDDGPINAMAPAIRNDMQALAVRDGDVSVEDAAAGRVDWAALGLPGFAEVSPDGAGGDPGTTPAPQQFAFQQPSPAPQQAREWSNQVGTSASPSGHRVGKAAERWDRAERASEGQAAPLASGMASRSAPEAPPAGPGWQQAESI